MYGRICLVAALLAPSATAAVSLPYLIASRVVVQRGLPVHIWGKADPGEAVTVAFRGAEGRSVADSGGRWSIYLPPGGAGGPFGMAIRGANAITFDDVLVGDVWVASGQSNMEWPIRWAADADREATAARYPRIRLVRAMHKTSEYPVEQLVGQMWRECTPESVADFSAVAYHFGRLIQEKTGVPIGLIQTAWGGTPLDAWTSLGAISQDPGLMPVFAEWELRMRAAPAEPGGHWEPGALYNAMVAPITRLPIRGVIWYQGEENSSKTRAPLYGRLFRAMIEDWRRAWGIGDFPFLFVQLANYTAPDSDWPTIREGQRQALAVRNTAMTVAIDVGTPGNIHPPDKKTVGMRLSLAARAVLWRDDRILRSGPAANHDGGRVVAHLVESRRRPGRTRGDGPRVRDRGRGSGLRAGPNAHRRRHGARPERRDRAPDMGSIRLERQSGLQSVQPGRAARLAIRRAAGGAIVPLH
jgi:sialate O-acetylesterase